MRNPESCDCVGTMGVGCGEADCPTSGNLNRMIKVGDWIKIRGGPPVGNVVRYGTVMSVSHYDTNAGGIQWYIELKDPVCGYTYWKSSQDGGQIVEWKSCSM